MEYNRKQKSLSPIDILKFGTVNTGTTFKQYDINTSILELELVANGEPVHLKDEKVYVTVKSSSNSSTQLISKYSGISTKEKDNYKVLLRAKKSRRKDVNNIIDVYISPLALENSGEMIAEVMIIDLIKEERVTSQSFTFNIEPSITPNRPSESVYKLVKDLDGTYITDAEDVQLLVAEVEPNFKLSFVGARVNEILEKANNFDVEDNTNKIHALQEKDVELESKISNLEKKDSSLDGEIASLKSSDQSIEEEVQGLKTKDESIESEISQLKLKDTSIDGEIDKLKNADETIKSDINSKYEELKQKTDSTNNEIVRLKAQDTTLSESIRTNKGLIDVINPKVTTLEQENQNVKNRVSVLEGDMNLAKSNISSLQSSNTELSQKVEGVEQGNASIDKILKQLQSDVERYKSSIELLESKVPVWKDFKGESFKVENSFYGKSRGLSIKGRTLNNLIKDGEGTFIIDKSSNEHSRIKVFKTIYPLQVGKEYTGYLVVNSLENTDRWLSIYGYKKDETNKSVYGNVRKNNNLGVVKFTWTPNNGNIDSFDAIGIYIENTDFNNGAKSNFSNFMLFEEGTDLTYIDKYFEGIKSFGEQEDKISILSHGKNLFNNYFEVGTLAGGNTIIDPQIFRTKDFIRVKSNTKYVFSSNNGSNSIVKVFYDKNKKWINDDITNSNTFTTPSNCEHIKLRSFLADNQLDWINASHMLEEGTQATSHQPYISNKKDILLQDLGFDEGLRGLSPTAYDELNDIENVAIKRISKAIFNGTENYIYSIEDKVNNWKFGITLADVKPNSTEVICNTFANVTMNRDEENVEGVRLYTHNQTTVELRFTIKKSKLNISGDTPTNEEIKNFFKNNNTEVYYELAEPVETPLNEDVNFGTLDDITYVSLENNIKNELSCQCQVSLASSKA